MRVCLCCWVPLAVLLLLMIIAGITGYWYYIHERDCTALAESNEEPSPTPVEPLATAHPDILTMTAGCPAVDITPCPTWVRPKCNDSDSGWFLHTHSGFDTVCAGLTLGREVLVGTCSASGVGENCHAVTIGHGCNLATCTPKPCTRVQLHHSAETGRTYPVQSLSTPTYVGSEAEIRGLMTNYALWFELMFREIDTPDCGDHEVCLSTKRGMMSEEESSCPECEDTTHCFHVAGPTYYCANQVYIGDVENRRHRQTAMPFNNHHAADTTLIPRSTTWQISRGAGENDLYCVCILVSEPVVCGDDGNNSLCITYSGLVGYNGHINGEPMSVGCVHQTGLAWKGADSNTTYRIGTCDFSASRWTVYGYATQPTDAGYYWSEYYGNEYPHYVIEAQRGGLTKHRREFNNVLVHSGWGATPRSRDERCICAL